MQLPLVTPLIRGVCVWLCVCVFVCIECDCVGGIDCVNWKFKQQVDIVALQGATRIPLSVLEILKKEEKLLCFLYVVVVLKFSLL
jgi:hypothetical protein